MERGVARGWIRWLIPVALVLGWTDARLHAAEAPPRAALSAAGRSRESSLQSHEFDLTLDYGEVAVGQSQTRTQTIVALCNAPFCFPIDFGTAVLDSANPDEFTLVSDTCSGSTISTGQSCGLTVRFQPQAAGVRTATIVLDSDAGNAPLVLTLQGGGKVGLPVPAQHQYDYPATGYDSSGKTIRQKGCALTSLAMALTYAGYPTDPAALNTLLDDHDGYSGSSVAWDPATRLGSGGALAFYGQRLDSSDPASYQFLNAALGAGFPVIVGVNLNGSGQPGHFVLVTGYQNGAYTINDPGHADRTTLDDYQGEFQTRGILLPSAGAIPQVRVPADRGDFSGLTVSVDDHATVLLEDGQSRRTGTDPSGGGELAEIPRSAHLQDALEDDLDQPPGAQVGDSVTVFQPPSSSYHASVTGVTPGVFTLHVQAYRADGAAQPVVTVPGVSTTGAASVELQLVNPGTVGGAVTKVVTFASALQDLSACGTLGLIRKQSLLKLLAKSINTAQHARTSKKRNAALQQFGKSVAHNTPRWIDAAAATVLQQDAAALLAGSGSAPAGG